MSKTMTADQIAEVFDLSVQWAQMHIGEHRCVDGRMYLYSCLVADPTTTQIARSKMKRIEEGAAQ